MHRMQLNALDCCALVHSFRRSPRQLARWSHVVGGLRLFAAILISTKGMDFELTPDVAATYRAFARSELRYLATAGDARKANFRCRHTIAEHEQALHAVLDRLPKTH